PTEPAKGIPEIEILAGHSILIVKLSGMVGHQSCVQLKRPLVSVLCLLVSTCVVFEERQLPVAPCQTLPIIWLPRMIRDEPPCGIDGLLQHPLRIPIPAEMPKLVTGFKLAPSKLMPVLGMVRKLSGELVQGHRGPLIGFRCLFVLPEIVTNLPDSGRRFRRLEPHLWLASVYGLDQRFTWVDLTRTAGPRPP